MRQLSRLLLVTLLLIGACAPFPVHRPIDANAPLAEQIAQRARNQLGSPYRYGGASPYGFDCSGLVYYVYRHAGLDVPRTTGAQYRAGRPVPVTQARPGDLLFFRINGKVSHVGIYLGGGAFVHAPETGEVVTTASLSEPWWRRHLAGVRRLAPDSGTRHTAAR
ncbi:MAG: C40 family peptidase [Gammaproteobacteria bacterium]|jgi:cell wall-associated NlpC family hydrolase